MKVFLALLAVLQMSAANLHDIQSLNQWGPYSKEYYGISHIDDMESGMMVEYCLVPGQYRRNFKVPCALYETDVHPWMVTTDLKHICYRHEIEWKDRVYVDATYHILDEHRVLLEAHCVNNSELLQNINLQVAVRKSGAGKGQWVPEITKDKNSFVLKYPEICSVYGLAWDHPYSEVRQFRTGKLEQLMPFRAHDHANQNFKGDDKGHYTANFLRPITIPAGKDTTLWQLVVCGPENYVLEQTTNFKQNEAELIRQAKESLACSLGQVPDFLPQAGNYANGERLIEATLMTNVVYPIDVYGKSIRHFCPGKKWNSLYTWDCGFIGWAMSEIEPYRGYEIIRQYTNGAEESAPFVHHGTPLAIQIFAIADVLKNNGFSEEMVREIYPRMKRFYSYMTGPEIQKPSGLLSTWKLFYNSGGWDDYCPQWYLRLNPDKRVNTTPVVSTAYYLRCAKILRMLAQHLGFTKDVKEYDADIRFMGDALQKYSWDAQAGYFSYVVHDTQGNAKDILRTEDGVNFNRGLDGVSPLVAGITDEKQTEILLGHIFTKGELWSDCGISAVDQSAPYYRVDGYWNGTVWIPHQMILWKTMLDLNLPDRAWQIASTALEKWEQECSDSYNCYEHVMIESGRGGGWFNFSGLSSPMVNWFCAYFKPGTISTGFNTMVTEAVWNKEKTGVKMTLEFDKDIVGKECAVLVCTTPGVNGRVFVNGKEISVTRPYDGLLQISVKASRKPIVVEL